MTKTVDVVIPLYNTEKFIINALESVERQTVQPKTVIVVNDGSNDNSAAVVEKYSKTSKLNIHIINKENGGLSSARNAGIAAGDAEYITFLDADDEWVSTKLEKQLQVFETSQFDNLGLVYTAFDLIDEDSKINEDPNFLRPVPKLRGDIFKVLLNANTISGSGSGVMIKSECFKECGNFDTQLTACEDWDMWLRIAHKYSFDYTTEVLVLIRRHDTNMQKNEWHMFKNVVLFINKWATTLNREEFSPEWTPWLVNYVIDRLPKKDFLVFMEQNISPESKKKLFAKTGGSIRMLVALVLAKSLIIGTIVTFKHYFITQIKSTYHLILLALP